MQLALLTAEEIYIKKELFCLFRQHHLTLNKYLDTLYSVVLFFFFFFLMNEAICISLFY